MPTSSPKSGRGGVVSRTPRACFHIMWKVVELATVLLVSCVTYTYGYPYEFTCHTTGAGGILVPGDCFLTSGEATIGVTQLDLVSYPLNSQGELGLFCGIANKEGQHLGNVTGVFDTEAGSCITHRTGGVRAFTFEWLAKPVQVTVALERDTWVQFVGCQVSQEHYSAPDCKGPVIASTSEILCDCQDLTSCECQLWEGDALSNVELSVSGGLPAAIGRRGCEVLISLAYNLPNGAVNLVG